MFLPTISGSPLCIPVADRQAAPAAAALLPAQPKQARDEVGKPDVIMHLDTPS